MIAPDTESVVTSAMSRTSVMPRIRVGTPGGLVQGKVAAEWNSLGRPKAQQGRKGRHKSQGQGPVCFATCRVAAGMDTVGATSTNTIGLYRNEAELLAAGTQVTCCEP